MSDKNSGTQRLQGSAILLFASLIWGTSFVAQKIGVDFLPPFALNGIRMLLGTVVLLPVIFVIDQYKKKKGVLSEITLEDKKKNRKNLLWVGSLCGICLFIASNLQQVGLIYTTAGKAGFVTSMYIVLVPIVGLFMGKRLRGLIIISLAIAVCGFYFLCINEGFSLNFGDFLVLLCAFGYTFHIVLIDNLGNLVDSVKLSAFQFAVCGVLSLIVSAFTESFVMEDIWLAMPAILYTGIGSSGIAYTLQIIGQKKVPPTMASLLMSFESVFSVLGGAVIMKDVMTVREGLGCLLVFIAVILSQLPEKTVKKEPN